MGCSKVKAARACPVREMYAPSTLFRLALEWAARECARAYVLSTKHGLLSLDTVIEPYDLRLSSLTHKERAAWGSKVGIQLDETIPWPKERNAEIIGLAPKLYLDTIDLPWEPSPREFNWSEPLKGLGIGERLAWFKKELVTGSHCVTDR